MCVCDSHCVNAKIVNFPLTTQTASLPEHCFLSPVHPKWQGFICSTIKTQAFSEQAGTSKRRAGFTAFLTTTQTGDRETIIIDVPRMKPETFITKVQTDEKKPGV